MDVPSNYSRSCRCSSFPTLALCNEICGVVDRTISFVCYCRTDYIEARCISVLRNIRYKFLDITEFLWRLWIFIKLRSNLFIYKVVNWSFQFNWEAFSFINIRLLRISPLLRSIMGFR